MTKPCTFAGCSQPVYARDLCGSHYQQRRAGKPLTPIRARRAPTSGTLAERFEARVQRGDGCWGWMGTIDLNGYGVLTIKTRSVMAHRLSYELHVAPIPDGLYIDHLCRNRGCVNPDHMEPVANGINVLRGAGPAARNARKTHCDRGHELAGANVYAPPKRPTARYCRACIKIREFERRTAA